MTPATCIMLLQRIAKSHHHLHSIKINLGSVDQYASSVAITSNNYSDMDKIGSNVHITIRTEVTIFPMILHANYMCMTVHYALAD